MKRENTAWRETGPPFTTADFSLFWGHWRWKAVEENFDEQRRNGQEKFSLSCKRGRGVTQFSFLIRLRFSKGEDDVGRGLVKRGQPEAGRPNSLIDCRHVMVSEDGLANRKKGTKIWLVQLVGECINRCDMKAKMSPTRLWISRRHEMCLLHNVQLHFWPLVIDLGSILAEQFEERAIWPKRFPYFCPDA